MLPPNTWLQPTAVDLVASLPAPTVPSLRSAAAEPKRWAALEVFRLVRLVSIVVPCDRDFSQRNRGKHEAESPSGPLCGPRQGLQSLLRQATISRNEPPCVSHAMTR
jgi:hypothetical protein